jgi:hypothetical protein
MPGIERILSPTNGIRNSRRIAHGYTGLLAWILSSDRFFILTINPRLLVKIQNYFYACVSANCQIGSNL